jgi:hypothetical protein
MFKIANQRNANQNHSEISAHSSNNGYSQKDNRHWQGCEEKITLAHNYWNVNYCGNYGK